MIENNEQLKKAFYGALELDSKALLNGSPKRNEVYAAFFFGLSVTMSGTYEIPRDEWIETLVETFQDNFGFTEEHTKEYIAFLMQSMQPRVNPKFFAVIRQGMDAFYDLEDGYTKDIKDLLPSLIDAILGTKECDVTF